MSVRFLSLTALCSLAVLSLAGPAAGFDPNSFDVYKYGVPDVNKPGVPPAALDPNDNSCWVAAAANLLGGAGYGTAGAQGIYNQLRNDLGTWNMGCADLAINYWLYTYGKNPSSPEYMPNNAYTDVTIVSKVGSGLTKVDYNFLLDELKRCQYVAVSFEVAPHCMTLVGGNYASLTDPNLGGLSVWHDSDRDLDPSGNDTYRNDFTPGVWNLVNPMSGLTYESKAETYVTLCPGLNKPTYAIENYDAAYFKQDLLKTGNWTPDFRTMGEKSMVYQQPMWDPADPNQRVIIGNEYIDKNTKEVWLLVDYKDRVLDRGEQIFLIDSNAVTWWPTVIESNDGGQAMYYWKLDYQPFFETIVFPNNAYNTLDSYVKDWDVATICPEPASAAVLALGGVLLWSRRRRNRR